VTVVDAPPRPQPSQEELEALIEEARRRTRRRRLIIAASVAAVLVAGAAVFRGVVLTRGGSGNDVAVPAGYHLVQAKGPVAHATITEYPLTRPRVVDLTTGNERRAPLVLEVWWDRRSGFDRVVGRVDGRVQFDTVGQTCQGPDVSGRFCLPPPPFVLENMHYRWPIDRKTVRVVGRGAFRGHDVIWLESLVNGKPSPRGTGGDRVALDSVTHRPLVKRTFIRGRLFYEELYSLLSDLPGKRVSFVVPDSGAARNSFPPLPNSPSSSRRATLAAAGRALGPAALWLGESHRGHRLRSVEVGTQVAEAPNGSILQRAKFVRFNYGGIRLQEFGRVKPLGFVGGPRPGRILVGDNIMLSRDGLLVIGELQPLPIDTTAALALAKALRPVPGG
jgi:hypothetical protein